jgi:outer membrane immunogenic protein
MKKLVRLSATPAFVVGMAALTPGAADAQSLLDDVNFYVGAAGGFMSGESSHHDAIGNDVDRHDNFGIVSAIAGATVRSDDWLFGVEGDIGLPLGDDLDEEDFEDVLQWEDMNFNAHVRGRVGRRFGSADLFIAAGLAVAEFDQKEESDGATESYTLTGFSIGAGVDWPIMESLIARVEILHDDYSAVDTTRFQGYTGDWADTTFRGGLLFQF